MCQAYEGEHRMVVAMESRATLEGFLNAHDGKRNINPYTSYFDKDLAKSWDHGRSCFAGRLLPWAVESVVRNACRDYGVGIEKGQYVSEFLKRNNRLPKAVRKLL